MDIRVLRERQEKVFPRAGDPMIRMQSEELSDAHSDQFAMACDTTGHGPARRGGTSWAPGYTVAFTLRHYWPVVERAGLREAAGHGQR
jgi:hypothetical protein